MAPERIASQPKSARKNIMLIDLRSAVSSVKPFCVRNAYSNHFK
jgi:hypothetical protein